MNLAAGIARLTAAAISFLYMLLLLPHLAGFEPGYLASPWFMAALLVALLWMPILWSHVRATGTHLRAAGLVASFAPLALLVGFFVLLFALAW